MIKCDLAKVGWSGPKILLQTEVATLLHSMIKNEVFTPEEIDKIVVDAKKTEEELAIENAKNIAFNACIRALDSLKLDK